MRGIRVLTDGIPLTEPDGRTSLEFVDLGSAGSVEVLRSNGSVLYGNASGGVVNLRTALDFERPYVEWQARGGSFGFHREQGVVGYTVGGARGVTSVYTSDFDGWRAHSGSATTSVQNRFSAPLDEESRLGFLLDFVSNLNRYPGALTAAQLAADPRQANPTFVARDERRFNRVGRFGITLERGQEGPQRSRRSRPGSSPRCSSAPSATASATSTAITWEETRPGSARRRSGPPGEGSGRWEPTSSSRTARFSSTTSIRMDRAAPT